MLQIVLDCKRLDSISGLVWDPLGRFFASSGGNDKHVRVWHNGPGYRAQIDDCKKKIVTAKSQALKVPNTLLHQCARYCLIMVLVLVGTTDAAGEGSRVSLLLKADTNRHQ